MKKLIIKAIAIIAIFFGVNYTGNSAITNNDNQTQTELLDKIDPNYPIKMNEHTEHNTSLES